MLLINKGPSFFVTHKLAMQSEEELELNKKIKELEKRENEIKEKEKDIERAKKEVEDELRRAKEGRRSEINRSGDHGRRQYDLETQIVRLKRRLDDFEDKEDRLLQRKRARQNKKRKRRMELEIRQRVRIEERERERVRKKII